MAAAECQKRWRCLEAAAHGMANEGNESEDSVKYLRLVMPCLRLSWWSVRIRLSLSV